jgi:hypothetical protein
MIYEELKPSKNVAAFFQFRFPSVVLFAANHSFVTSCSRFSTVPCLIFNQFVLLAANLGREHYT